MTKKYIVTLTDEEQTALNVLTHKGKVAARRLTRAHILRMAQAKCTDAEIAQALHTSVATIVRIRERFVVGGVDYALQEEPRLGARAKLDGKQEAFLIALACSTPPTGHQSWTLQLLADKLIELEKVEPPLSDETVRRTLKKTISSRGCEVSGAFPPSVLNLCGGWKTCSTCTPSHIIRTFQWSVSMNARIS